MVATIGKALGIGVGTRVGNKVGMGVAPVHEVDVEAMTGLTVAEVVQEVVVASVGSKVGSGVGIMVADEVQEVVVVAIMGFTEVDVVHGAGSIRFFVAEAVAARVAISKMLKCMFV